MYSTLDVELKPGYGLGIFELGASLWSTLDLLRSNSHSFPQVDMKYDPDSPTTPVMLHIRPHLDLLFSGYRQRLHTICLRKLRDPNPPVTLRYKNTILSSVDEVLRRVGVSRVFGPTYPGDDLRYPGVWFSFDDEGRSEGLRGGSPPPEERHQEVRRVVITQQHPNDEVNDPLSEVRECTVMFGDVEKAIIKVHDGVTLHFHPKSSSPVRVRLGITTAQDLNCDLGPPMRVYYKEDDRMTIHSGPSREQDDVAGTHYFYNYFQHGIEFLIHGSTHRVSKIIMHTNIPGTPLFQRYKRCPWAIEGKPEDDEDDAPSKKWFYDRYEDISHFLGPNGSPPSMTLDRTDEEDDLTLPNPTTHLHGFDGIVLEVTESAQVASVTLY